MDKLLELFAQLEKIAELSLEDLQKLDLDFVTVFEAITKGEDEIYASDDIEVLGKIAESTQLVREKAEELQKNEAEKGEKIAELAKIVNAKPASEIVDEPVDEEDPEKNIEESTEAETVDEDSPKEESEQTKAAEEEIKKAPLPALAAATAQRNMKVQTPAKTRPRQATLVDVAGEKLTVRQIAERMIERRDKFGGHTPKDVEERISVATFKLDIPEERFLRSTDSSTVIDEKISSLVAGATDPNTWSGLTASGGSCAPLATRYEIETVAGAHRPVRDALPSFGADRGGLRFRGGISIAESDALGGTGKWANSTDVTPGGSTKNTGTVACDTITDVSLDAIYKQLKFGNFRGRADAEGVAAWIEATNASWARTGDTALLDAIGAASTAVSTDAHMGLGRDFLNQLSRAAATYRSRNRMPADAQLRVMLPQWLPDAIATDLTLQSPGDNITGISASEVIQKIQARGVNVTLYADQATGSGQIYGAQGAHDLLGWKSTAVWYLFHEGAFLFLDGGTLDLGIVRDSTLNETNDYKIFAETFEQVAFVGVESLKITTNVCVSGTSSLAKDFSSQCIS